MKPLTFFSLAARSSLLRLGLAVVTPLAAGCSADDEPRSTPSPDAGNSDTDSPLGVDGPAARVVGTLTGGNGVHLGAASTQPLPGGWVEEEYAVEGTAVAYAAEGALPADGMFALAEDGSAEYRTRIVVRRPESPDDFNGTVVVEWLNVSGGLDANPDFAYLADELYRGGYAWVGVSAQHVGIEGGEVLVSTPVSEEGGAGLGLRVLDPERYETLHHPGDAFAYDIYTQVARALRVGGEGSVLGDLVPARLLAVGESQSGFMLTTYVNGVHPLALQYDGFLIHSRGGGSAPLGEPGTGIDLISGIGSEPMRVRTDLDAPVLMLQTETDMLFVLNYFPARQPDTNRIRTWEVAGTAHADQYLLGDITELFECAAPINAGPHHFIAKAALRRLNAWVRDGELPPEAARLQIDDSSGTPVFVRDANGNALEGVRTPQVDVPVDTLSGAPAGGSVACTLFGSTTPLSAERLAELYASPEAYLEAYTQAADRAIAAGFVLEEDRDALLADADASRLGG